MTPEEQARRAMIEKRFGGNTNGAATGGAGSARRKAKGTPKSVGGNYIIYHLFVLSASSCIFIVSQALATLPLTPCHVILLSNTHNTLILDV